MKKRVVLNSSLIVGTVICMGIAVFSLTSKHVFDKTEAVDLPTTINLKDNTHEEIKTFYNGLSGKTSDQLKGTNLLKNLKGIINDGSVDFFTYAQVSEIYVITDRDWVNSPASSMTNYNDSLKQITSFSHSTEVNNNPYLHMLYCDYDVQGKTKYKGDGDVSTTSVSFDKEHAWSQSHGFDNGTSSGSNLVGAGSDLHHLKAGTQYGNRTLHSNYSYGFVKENDGDWSSKTYETKNKRGEPLFAHDDDQQTKVFEPQDCDKGDIARALLYMVACYNNYDGSTPTPANPALQLVNYVISSSTTGYSSENIENGYYGILQDILAWHKMDPVDEFEIHRNNLIYNNYQHNRNPFIDYPQWVDYIWGTSSYDAEHKTITYNDEPTGNVDLNKDVINGYRALKDVVSIEVTHAPSKTTYYVDEPFDSSSLVITATYSDASTENVTENCSYTVDTSSVGNKTVTISFGGKTTTQSITVVARTESVTSVYLNKTQVTLEVGEETTLNANVLPTNASNKNVNWSSSNSSIASVSNGVVSANAEGVATITVTTVDGNKTATCEVTVTEPVPGATVTDTLNKELTGNPGANSYVNWSEKTSNSSAVYKGNSAGGNSSIQLRGSDNSGIVTTYSGGVARKVTVQWYDGTTAGRTINVYGSSSAFSATSELYDENIGDSLLGTIVKGTSTELIIAGSHPFIGIRADSGALYASLIQIEWLTSAIEVTGVNLSHDSMTLGIGESEQLTATVSPAGATNKNVTWTSNNSSIATVDESGLVTGVAPGNTTIVVETEDGGFIDECVVTIAASSPYTNGQPYKFTVTKTDSIKRYINGQTTFRWYYGDTSTNYADGITIYFEQNGKGQNMYFMDNAQKKYISIVLSGTYRNFSISTSEPTDPWLYDNGLYVSISGAKYILGIIGDYDTIAAYSATREGCALCKVEQTAESFSYNIINKITCDNSGETAPVFADGFSWQDLNDMYDDMDSSQKTILRSADADEGGSLIEQAMAKYDVICRNYPSRANFINRNLSNGANWSIVSKDNQIVLVMIVITSTIAITSIAGYLILRKKYQR